jgi:hypothetical protein
VWDLPFVIRKGEDGWYYEDKNGKEQGYNMGKTTTKKWIAYLDTTTSNSLEDMFEITVMEDVTKLIAHCVKLYKRSLLAELKLLEGKIQEIKK